MDDSVHSEGLFNQSFDSDDLEAFDIQDPDFGNFAEADESGYYSSDQLQEAIDRAFIVGFNEALDRMEQEIDELESEDWVRGDINNHDMAENFHFNLALNDELVRSSWIHPNEREDNIAPYDLAGSSQQDDDVPHKAILHNCQQLFQYNFYEEIDNEAYQRSYYLERLSGGSSRSWSPRSMREHRIGNLDGYRRYSYPTTARDFLYLGMDDEPTDDEMDNLTNLLRMGLTTRDESPPTRAAPDPRELALRQSTDYRLLIGGGGHRRRYGSNRSVFSEDRSPVRPRRCRVRRGVKRYRTRRSLSGSPRVSTKRRRSLPPIARRFNAGYTSSSESDEEPMEEVSYIDRTIAGNYPLRSRRNATHIRTSRRRLSRSRNPLRRRRSSQRYPRSRLYGRLHRVDSGRIKRRF